MDAKESQAREVVVVGGGIIGASTAMWLAKSGAKVTVVERWKVAGAASGKAGGFLAKGWGSGPTEALHQVGFELHKKLAQELKMKSFRHLPTLNVSTGGRKMKGAASKCKWLDGHVSGCKMMDPNTAQVTPVEITNAMMKCAQDNGAKLVMGKATGVKRDKDGNVECVALADGKVIVGDEFVFTMGPWTVQCEEWFPGFRVPMVGIYSSSIILKHPEGSVDPFALFCSEDSNGCHLEVYPRPEGDVYVCGCGGSRHLPRKDIEKLDPSEVVHDPKRVAAAMTSFRGMSPSLAKDTPDVAQACMRPCTDDGMPMMGRIPNTGNAYVATGHNCWGILWGPVTGLAMAELVLDGKSHCVDISAFNPSRFQAKKGRRSRQKGEEDVGEDW